MIGAATFINSILKIVSAVVILGASYLFVVRPLLDSTESVTADIGRQAQVAQSQAQQASEQFDLEFARNRAISFAGSLQGSWPAASREVRLCVAEAAGDPRAMGRCDELGQRLISQVQSSRSFALAYATSLESQGRGDAAASVRRCVERAGFAAGAMQRCRNLADRLLFG